MTNDQMLTAGSPRVRAILAAALGGALLASPQARSAPPGLAATPPTAHIADGRLIGTQLGPIDAFLGVPYAAPPVGDLRFRAPQPHAAWTTPRQATQVAQTCPLVAPNGSPTGSEDCLYLNVFTPSQTVAGGRPVMVYIPGGGFTRGSASSPYYNGQYIAEQAGVIVVVITYRVGALGFLTAPALDAETPARTSGNYGLLDQQAALRWVRDNIAAFGGNPQNVTLFGESAGADSTEYALATPATAGLFQRAIIESAVGGVLIPNLPIAVAEATGGATVISAVGCANASDVAACLRALPAAAFLTPAATTPGSSLPVVDGVVLPQQPLQAFRSGRFNRVPVILGSNHDEGTAFVWPIEAALGGPLTAAGYSAQLQGLYGPVPAEEVAGEYPVGAYPSPIQALAAVYTDANVACPTFEKRKALARYVPVYGFEFNEPNPARGPLLGPPEPGLAYGDYHTAELPYVFGVTAPSGVPVAGKDLALSQSVISYWTNFATIGDPNRSQAIPFWFDYRLRRQLISLQDQITQLPDSKFNADHHCSFWAIRSQE